MDQINNNLHSTEETQLSRLIGGDERTESDATHYRLRDDQLYDDSADQHITCVSCGKKFVAKNIGDLYQHYTDVVHKTSFGQCLYCKGKVHQYYSGQLQKDKLKVFHDCLRWKRGDFK